MTSAKRESEEMTMEMKMSTKSEAKETKKRKPKASNNGSGRTYRRGKYWAYEIRRQYWDGIKTMNVNRYAGKFKTKPKLTEQGLRHSKRWNKKSKPENAENWRLRDRQR